jgi:hypothetical protein
VVKSEEIFVFVKKESVKTCEEIVGRWGVVIKNNCQNRSTRYGECFGSQHRSKACNTRRGELVHAQRV